MITNIFTVKDLMYDDSAFEMIIKALDFNMPYLMDSAYIRDYQFRPYMSNIREDVLAIVEDDYVDKTYRNYYSNFSSTKLNHCSDRCVRLSFVEPLTDLNSLLVSHTVDPVLLQSLYLGFMILRPIFPGLVGRSAINPKATKDYGLFSINKAEIDASIAGYKVKVEAFPHSSQDSEYCTCAETSIWCIMEYFGNKYPEYSPILPSEIHKRLDGTAFERHIPSCGLKYSDISFILKSCGFGCKVYSLQNRSFKIPGFSQQEFHSIMSCYVESGIPMVAAVNGNNLGHAIVCVGQENIDRAKIDTVKDRTFARSGRTFKFWSDVERKYVFNDDNTHAYSINDYSCPTPQYSHKKPYISSLIVPLNKKIYLDAPTAIHHSQLLCDSYFSHLPDDIVLRTLLTTGRSYKNSLMIDLNLTNEIKTFIMQYITLPKFIWVTEIAGLDSFKKNIVNGIILMDATEPMKYSTAYPILVCVDKDLYFFDKKAHSFKKYSLPLSFSSTSFNNLK